MARCKALFIVRAYNGNEGVNDEGLKALAGERGR